MTDRRTVVADAGPIIHLDELGCLDLLDNMGNIFVPTLVLAEIQAFRADLSITSIPHANVRDSSSTASQRLETLITGLDLHAGEIAALKLAEQIDCGMFLCDDAAARVAGESLGLRVHGTIGVVVRSIRTRRHSRDQVTEILGSIPECCSLHISRPLLVHIIESVKADA